jgi:N-acetylglucosaminyldiphosphoundecaprenol N-acetyl-beta-D-mannosaminyltransferase
VAEVRADGVRPRALFLSADLPWPRDGGGRIAALHILESMCRRYEVDLVAMADPVGEPDLEYLRSICRSVEVVRIPFTFGRHRLRQMSIVLRSLVSAEPYRLRKFRSRRFEAAVRDRLKEADYAVVHVDQFGVVPYVRFTPDSAVRTATHHNVESDIYRLAANRAANPIGRAFAANERMKLIRAEKKWLNRVDRVFVLADDDATLLRGMGVDRTTVIPMPAPETATRDGIPPPGRRILTLGSMSWYGVADGLLWFHDQVLPLIRAAVPEVEWELVGANAPASIRRLSREPGIIVTGYVEDLAPHVDRARVGVVPLRIAGGVRLKLLDFMARGLPAVATSVGARGLDIPDGSGCFKRDEPDTFAAAVVDLLIDDGRWAEAAAAGQAFVREHHSTAGLDRAIAEGVDLATQTHRQRGPQVVQIGSLFLDNVTTDETDAQIKAWLADNDTSSRYVCTPNVDYVIKSGRDPIFRAAINSANLRVPDGMGIVYSSRLAGRPLRGTVTGRLLLPRFADYCAGKGLTLGLMGAGPGVAQAATEKLKAGYPGLQIVHAVTPPKPFVVGSTEDAAIVAALKAQRPDLLFVALGAPKQEIWMKAHAAELAPAVLIGVGAALDVVAGKVREAPRWMTRTGMEWLFRLAQEPRRLARRYLWDDPRILIWALATRLRGSGRK